MQLTEEFARFEIHARNRAELMKALRKDDDCRNARLVQIFEDPDSGGWVALFEYKALSAMEEIRP